MKVYKQARCLLALLALSMTYGNLYAQEPEIYLFGNDVGTGNICGPYSKIAVQNLPVGYTVVWSVEHGSGQIKNNTSSETSVDNLDSSPTEIKVDLYSDGVIKQTLTQILTNIKPPEIVVEDDQIETCTGSASLEWNNYSPGCECWWSTKGAGTITHPSSAYTSISSIPAGSSEQVSLKVFNYGYETCYQEKFLTVTNNQVIVGTSPQEVYTCDGTYNLVAEDPAIKNGSGAYGIWVPENEDGSSIENRSSCNTIVSGIQPNYSAKYRWSVHKGNCEENQIIMVKSFQLKNVYAGEDKTICGSVTEVGVHNSEHLFGQWSVVPENNSIWIASPDINFSYVDYLPKGSTTLRWTVSNEHCSAFDDVVITNNQVQLGAIPAEKITCYDRDTVFVEDPIIKNGSEATGKWSKDKELVSMVLDFPVDFSTMMIVSNLDNHGAENLLKWTVTRGTCEATQIINIKSYKVETNAGPDETVVKPYVVLHGSIADGETGTWSVVPENNAITIYSPHTIDPYVEHIPQGTTKFRWTVTNGHCSGYDDVEVTYNPPEIDAPSEVCGDEVVISVKNLDNDYGHWELSNRNVVLEPSYLPNTKVSNLPMNESVTLTWHLQDGRQVSKTITNIRAKAEIITPRNQNYQISSNCKDNVMLSAPLPGGYAGTWNKISGKANFSNGLVNTTTTMLENIGTDPVVVKWSLYKEGHSDCVTSTSVEVVSNLPLFGSITKDTETCSDQITLTADNPTILNGSSATGLWQKISGNSNTDLGNKPSIVANLNEGTNKFKWIVSNGICNDEKIVTITSKALHPTVPNADITTTNSRAVVVANNPPSKAKEYHWETVSAGERTTIMPSTALEAKVRYLKAGTNTFKFVVSNDDCDAAVEVRVKNDNLVKSLSASDVSIQLSKTSYTYTGAAFKPDVTVKDGSELLELTNDYTISYKDNIAAGTAKAVITGVGNYSGVVEKEFTIASKTSTATCQLDKSTFAYTGLPIKPTVTVKVGNETIPSEQYTVAYSNNTNAGTASVIVTSKSGFNYTFSAVKTNFTISKVPLTVTAKNNTVTYGNSPKNAEVTFSGFVNNESNDVLSGTSAYTYSYKVGDNVGEYTITPGGLKADNYDISYVAGKLTVTPQSIVNASVDLKQTQLYYTGDPKTPSLSVSNGGVTLTAGTDYSVEYADNLNVGTAKATITGKGNYTGVVEKEFTIEPNTANAVCKFENAPYTYTDSPIEPSFAVKVGEETIPADQYTFEFSNNTNAGTATVTITGKSGFNYDLGTFEANFTIGKALLTVTALDTCVNYGKMLEADSISVSGFLGDDDESVLEGALKFDFGYHPGDDIGEYIITPRGLQATNYEFTYVPGKLTVLPMSIENVVLEFALSQLRYTGDPLTPSLSVSNGGVTLTPDIDYTVEYADNVEVGTAKATVTAKGNYKGSVSKEFTILEPQKPYLSFEPGQEFTYSGSAIKPAVVVMLGDNPMDESNYIVTYTDNTNAGTALIKVENSDDSDIEFSFDASFTILQASFTDAQADPVQSPVGYTGFPLYPDFDVTFGDSTLVVGTDYLISFADNVEIGTGTATLTGMGNYQGTITKQFEIKLLPTSLTFTALPKLQYAVDEEFDTNGGELLLEYSNHTTEQISLADAAISGFDSEKIGPKKVVATYKGVSASLSVTVVEQEKISQMVPEQENGVNQISSPEQLFWFINQVNNGNTKLDAALTQNIVINQNCLNRLSLTKKDNDEFELIEWQPIGTLENPFEGSFNGQGYTISGLYINSNTENNVGLFGAVAETGTIKNVGVVDSYIKGDENVGALCGSNEGTIVNCYNTSIIQGNDNVGAITGSVAKEAVVANSYSVGKATTTAGEEKGVSGVASEKVQNCFYLTEKANNKDAQAKIASEFKSGEVAKTLVEGAKTLAEEKENNPVFVLEVFNVDVVLPGVEEITISDPIPEPEEPEEPENPEYPENPENPETSVTEVSNSNVRIWSYANTIFVENAGEDIYVISLSGTTIKKASPESSRIEISISNPGIYIVKTGKVLQKVLIQ